MKRFKAKRNRRGLYETKNYIKVDLEKAKQDLKNAIKERDPFLKWLPTLNELKAELDDTKSKNISIIQILKILVASGINVPNEVLKKFLGLQKK